MDDYTPRTAGKCRRCDKPLPSGHGRLLKPYGGFETSAFLRVCARCADIEARKHAQRKA